MVILFQWSVKEAKKILCIGTSRSKLTFNAINGKEKRMAENKINNKKYVIIDKVNGFGYASSKYADMFNMTMPEFATVFQDKDVAEKTAFSLNANRGYELQVFDYEEALLSIIKENAEKVKEKSDDNATRNRMQSIICSVEKLQQEIQR